MLTGLLSKKSLHKSVPAVPCTSKAAAGSDTGMGSVVCEVPAEPWLGPKEIGLPAKAQAVFSMWELVLFVQLWLARAPSGHVLAYSSRLSSTTDQ